MTRADESAEVRRLLREAVTVRLASHGWEALDDEAGRGMTWAAFERPLDHGFAAIAEIVQALGMGLAAVVVTDVRAGVCYEPLRRMWPLLGDHFRGALVWDFDEDDERDEDWKLEIDSVSEVDVAADHLAELVTERTAAFAASESWSVDELLADHSSNVDQVGPALLAAAGRLDKARDSLARYRPVTGAPVEDAKARRFAFQLGRWLDAGGDVSLIPDPPPPDRSEPPSLSEVWSTARHAARGRRDALEAVRRGRAGKDRAELRRSLDAELARRNVDATPLSVERALDELRDPGERARLRSEALGLLGRVGVSAFKAAVRDRKLPDLGALTRSAPDWLEPPDRAAYRAPGLYGSDWVAATLDRDADDWLDRAHSELTRVLGTAQVDVWLQRASATRGAGSELAVHLGERRVGTLDGHAAQAYAPLMAAAEFRDELPRVRSRLTVRPTPRPDGSRYLLELLLPPHE